MPGAYDMNSARSRVDHSAEEGADILDSLIRLDRRYPSGPSSDEESTVVDDNATINWGERPANPINPGQIPPRDFYGVGSPLLPPASRSQAWVNTATSDQAQTQTQAPGNRGQQAANPLLPVRGRNGSPFPLRNLPSTPAQGATRPASTRRSNQSSDRPASTDRRPRVSETERPTEEDLAEEMARLQVMEAQGALRRFRSPERFEDGSSAQPARRTLRHRNRRFPDGNT